jgi:hypothetical protein
VPRSLEPPIGLFLASPHWQVHGAWAINTSETLIVFDALLDHAVVDEGEGRLEKLGLDPTKMKTTYPVVSQADGQ